MATEETEESAGAEAKATKSASPWPPVLAVIILMPAISFAMTQYVLIPKLKASIPSDPAKTAAAGDAGASAAAKSEAKKDVKPTFTYEFSDIVVNLSGALGTRYLKTTFSVFSTNQDLPKIVADNKSHLLDVALNVLSSKSLADLEAPGSKNIVRNDLITNFNQALGAEVVDQIYFSEFVVQ